MFCLSKQEGKDLDLNKNEFFQYRFTFNLIKSLENRFFSWRISNDVNQRYRFPSPPFFKDEKGKITLKDYKKENIDSLDQTLVDRSSKQPDQFNAEWDISDLSSCLKKSIGLRNQYINLNEYFNNHTIKLRRYPSAGAMYSVHTYLYINKVKGLLSGLYYYDVDQENLILLSEKISHEKFQSLFAISLGENTAFSLFFVADLEFTFYKYGALAYKLALIESGHMTQNIQLVTTQLGKNSLPTCAFYADRVENFLNIDKKKYQHCIYSMLAG